MCYLVAAYKVFTRHRKHFDYAKHLLKSIVEAEHGSALDHLVHLNLSTA